MISKKIQTFLIVFYFVLFPFGQLDRIETSFLTIHITDVIIGLSALTYLVSSLIYKKDKAYLGFPLISFGAICLMSYLINFGEVSQTGAMRGFFYLLRLWGYILFFFALVDWGRNNAKIINKSLFMIGTLITLFALLQYILVPDTRVLFHFGWDGHYFRSIGTFLDPAFLGILLVFFILYIILLNKDRKIYKAILILAVIALALTFSRASFLALFFGLMAINFKSIKLGKTLIVTTTLAVALLLSPKPGGEGVNLSRTSTINFRLINYSTSIEHAAERPLFGYGYNLINWQNSGQIDNENHSSAGVDSSLLFVLLTTGVVGLSIFLSLIWEILSKSWRGKSEVSLLVFSSFIAVLAHSLFQNSFFYPWVLGWMMVLLALMEVEDFNRDSG